MSDTYFLRVKETIQNYIYENGFHLEDTEVMEAIKCAVEDLYLSIGRRVIFDISKMPPEILDVTNEVQTIPFKKMFGVIEPRHFLERIKFFVERFEREKIFSIYRPYKGQVIKCEVMGETFFLGRKGYKWIKINKRFEGTIREFGELYGFYVESGKERIVVYPRDYRMWDLANYIYEETGYVASINPHRKILRLKKQGKAVIFNVYGTLAIMPGDERIPKEKYEQGVEYEVILYDVNQSNREGYQLYVSRRQIEFFKKLITLYIPEFEGVKIKAIAREPGVKSKILIQYNGKKIKWKQYGDVMEEIRKKLSGEKIEIIEYDPEDIEKTIQAALNYEGSVKINSFDKTATIVTTKKGFLIGEGGVNVKLAGMLTGFKFTVLTPEEYIKTL